MATTPEVEREDEFEEQEILAPPQQMFDSKTLAILQKSEIDQQISTAKKYPRQITKVLSTATALVTADPDTADEMIYALPRGGKLIEGPSVRFAEAMAHSYGNCRCGARVLSEDEETVTAQGMFFDLETNVAITIEVRRRIVDKKGNRFNTDVIQQTANAACSIGMRNAILRAIPKPLWKKPYAAARMAVAGDIKTLDTRRVAMLKAFELMGVKREAIFKKLEVKGVDDISLDHLVTLRGIYNAVREHEISADKAFAPEPANTEDTALANKSKKNLEAIKEKYAQPAEEPKPIAETDPAKAEKLRKEAARQKKAVAEKYGAPAGEKTGTVPAVAVETAPTVAPSVSEGAETQQQPSDEGPETAGAESGPEAENQSTAPAIEEDGQTRIPRIFDEPEGSK